MWGLWSCGGYDVPKDLHNQLTAVAVKGEDRRGAMLTATGSTWSSPRRGRASGFGAAWCTAAGATSAWGRFGFCP